MIQQNEYASGIASQKLNDPNSPSISTNVAGSRDSTTFHLNAMHSSESITVQYDEMFAPGYGYEEYSNVRTYIICIGWLILYEFQFCFHIQLQLIGNRFYLDSTIRIKSDQIRKLKSMNKNDQFDYSFISYALLVVFGDDCLKKSSVGGNISNFNGKCHLPLDPVKLEFVKSMYMKHDILVQDINFNFAISYNI